MTKRQTADAREVRDGEAPAEIETRVPESITVGKAADEVVKAMKKWIKRNGHANV